EKNIFPEYYLIIVDRYKNQVKRKIDEWIYMIKNNEVAKDSVSKNIDKARQKLAEINMEEQERRSYEKYLINLVRDRDVFNTAKEEGKIEGEAALLKRLLTHKFGKLPEWAQEVIDNASSTQLETWGEKIFDAANLKQLLDNID
ncbi:hypothetical protein TI05_03615, partial [Achromatium sp. WMS3]